LVELYKLGRASYTRLLFSGGDLTALGRTYGLIGSLARRDQERFDGHRQTIAELAASRATLESGQVEVRSLLSGALVAESDARRDLTALLVGELVAARERLDSTLDGLGNNGELAAARVALPLGPFRGQSEPPVPGEITVAFGSEQTSEFGTIIARAGVELAAGPGESVYAVHGGTVVHAGLFEGLGTLVIIDHGDQAFSLYGYLGGLAVHTGVEVDARTLLGTAARSPTGNQAVYFELRIDGRPVDPVEWFE
jgi:septal ring factor EnvC (AmiA/AmiB activator)